MSPWRTLIGDLPNTHGWGRVLKVGATCDAEFTPGTVADEFFFWDERKGTTTVQAHAFEVVPSDVHF